ncbi:protein spdB [Streptomyces sp. NPDC054796]
MRATTMLPAVAMTAVSMVLTLAVVVMWLGGAVPKPVALVVGLGIDGGWLATLAYERRLAAQGDHNRTVTVIGWAFGLGATGVLVAHALTAEHSAVAWLSVAWLPLAAKALWVVHSLWERTALTPTALEAIQGIQQEARDEAAVARARLRAEAGTEETRLAAVTQAGARVARVQAATAETLSHAWATLEKARKGEGTGRALTSVTAPVTPGVTPRWELPIWGPTEPVPALEAAPALTDEALDALVLQIRDSDTPPLSYRETAARFRAAGHAASEVRLRAAWKRVATSADSRVGGEGRS